MEKWFEKEGKDQDVVIASRIRLSRNIAGHRFPCTMEDEENEQFSKEIIERLSGLSTITEHRYQNCRLDRLSLTERMALSERAVINKSMALKKQPVSAVIAEDESIGIIINGDDHVRIQSSIAGNNLSGAWMIANRIDDYINEKYEYAFDEQYGYLTTFPTNMGTGMKAYMILHLPYLSAQGKFSGLIAQMSRFGVQLKGVVGSGDNNHGSLFVAYNQSTLGQSEEDKIEKLNNICGQLIRQEQTLRERGCTQYANEYRDQAYKAYGLLKYARMLSLKDALVHLSLIRTAAYQGLIEIENPNYLYDLMIGSLPNHIHLLLGNQNNMNASGSAKELKKEEKEAENDRLMEMRASFVRDHLPAIS